MASRATIARMAAEKRKAKPSVTIELAEAPHAIARIHATEDDVKRAASLALRVHELAHFVAGQVASWSRLGEPFPGETKRALADLETSLATLEHGREMDAGSELEAVVRDVIELVRKGNLVRGAVTLVADATRKTNESLARQIVDSKDALIAIVDKVIFFQLPPDDLHELVRDLAVRMRMLAAPPPKVDRARGVIGAREVVAVASVAGRRGPKAGKRGKSRDA